MSSVLVDAACCLYVAFEALHEKAKVLGNQIREFVVVMKAEDAMSTMNRIVLCNSTGDELFSGNSVLSKSQPPLEQEEEDEPVPPTLRSTAPASEPVSRPIIVEDADLTAA